MLKSIPLVSLAAVYHTNKRDGERPSTAERVADMIWIQKPACKQNFRIKAALANEDMTEYRYTYTASPRLRQTTPFIPIDMNKK